MHNEVAFTISADSVRFGDIASVSVDCAPVTAAQIAHSGRVEINFPDVFDHSGADENAQLIPGELLQRIEAAGGSYTLEPVELMPTTSIGSGGWITGFYLTFECEAGIEMNGNLFTYTQVETV